MDPDVHHRECPHCSDGTIRADTLAGEYICDSCGEVVGPFREYG